MRAILIAASLVATAPVLAADPAARASEAGLANFFVGQWLPDPPAHNLKTAQSAHQSLPSGTALTPAQPDLGSASLFFKGGPKRESLELSAQDLADGFAVNEVLARETLKTKDLTVVGKVMAVRQGAEDEILILIRLRSPFQGLTLHMGPDQKLGVMALAPGDTIRVACREFAGWRMVDGSGCHFQE